VLDADTIDLSRRPSSRNAVTESTLTAPTASVRGVHATDGDVDIIAHATRALIADDDHAARAALAPIAGQTIVTHPVVAASQRPGRYPVGAGVQTRSPSRSVIGAVYRRDRFTCVYCARRTVVLPVLGLVSELLPAEFPWHPNWRRDVAHRFYWDLSTTLEHVEAVSTGGDWQAERNLVTACARCQYQKGNRSVADLGWQIRRTTASWDGLTALLPELWQRAGRPARMAPWVAEYQGRPH
jgi:5-methylcytosine-specific restriction endonuclease McrA